VCVAVRAREGGRDRVLGRERRDSGHREGPKHLARFHVGLDARPS
jgi:hypothetical protein